MGTQSVSYVQLFGPLFTPFSFTPGATYAPNFTSALGSPGTKAINFSQTLPYIEKATWHITWTPVVASLHKAKLVFKTFSPVLGTDLGEIAPVSGSGIVGNNLDITTALRARQTAGVDGQFEVHFIRTTATALPIYGSYVTIQFRQGYYGV